MPVKAIPRISAARNGVGAFVRPCYKISIQYCNWGGSSQGVRDLLSKGALQNFASSHKDTVVEISRRQGHPKLTFQYNSGAVESVDARNLLTSEVLRRLDEYVQRSGNAKFKFNQKVMPLGESVRGVWSPFHEAKENRHRI